jgi:glycosyltransferase involved in cell wall biosynthesis
MTVLVSVVVLTCRRPQLLDRCLHALVAQNFEPTQYEIIVADDADDPATKQQVMSWRQRAHGLTEILYAPVWDAHGPAAARNVGWRLSTGRVIAFTDDDTIPRRDWLTRGFATIRGDIAAAAGRVHTPQLARPCNHEFEDEHWVTGEFVTANCFVRREILLAIGGFDERFTSASCEDSDLIFSVLEAKGKVVASPSAVVIRPARPVRWGGKLRQQRKFLFDALLYKKHASLYRDFARRTSHWDHYAIVLALAVAAAAWTTDSIAVTTFALAVWLAGTAGLCRQRLRETSHRPGDILELIATSILIPPLVVFWRLVGAIRFGAFVA